MKRRDFLKLLVAAPLAPAAAKALVAEPEVKARAWTPSKGKSIVAQWDTPSYLDQTTHEYILTDDPLINIDYEFVERLMEDNHEFVELFSGRHWLSDEG